MSRLIGTSKSCSNSTFQQTELSRKEQTDGVLPLLAKIALYRPRIVCFVGIGIADVVKAKTTCVRYYVVPSCSIRTQCLSKKSGTRAKATIGLQAYKMVYSRTAGPASTDIAETETLFYAVSSTSGRVVKYQVRDCGVPKETFELTNYFYTESRQDSTIYEPSRAGRATQSRRSPHNGYGNHFFSIYVVPNQCSL